MEQIKVSNLDIEVRRSTRRKNVDLTVDRGGEIVVAVPDDFSQDDIEDVVRKKLVWLHTTLDRKQKTQSNLPPKEFVSGQGFYYLGRKYRLQLCPPGDGATPRYPLDFSHGRFLLHRDSVKQGNKLFRRWYTLKAKEWLDPKVKAFGSRVDAYPVGIGVRDLGFRWASCTQSGKVYFHWRTILLPPERIEYLILHELVHLHEHNHSPEFYQRLQRACPDYLRHEAWLSRYGDSYSL